MDSSRNLDGPALFAAAVTALGWGLTGVVIRLLPPVSPLAVTSARLWVASAVTLPMVCILFGRQRAIWRVWQQPAAFGLALLLTSYYALATAAFQLAPVAEVALLLSTPPLFVVLWNRIRGHKPDRAELAGAFIAMAGLVWLLAPRWSPATAVGDARLAGDALALCASLLVAAYALFYRTLETRIRAPHIGGLMLMTFTLGGGVLAALQWTMHTAPWRGLHLAELPLWLALGVLCTALPSAGYAFASQRLPALVSTSTSLLLPLLAALFAYALLGEGVTPRAIPGATLVLAGIALILRLHRARRP